MRIYALLIQNYILEPVISFFPLRDLALQFWSRLLSDLVCHG